MKADQMIPSTKTQRHFTWLLLVAVVIFLAACDERPWNDPQLPSPDGLVTYQSMIISTPPKHLDPAISYASDESLFTMQIYEPPLTYHFLKRPYELIPGALVSLPEVSYLDSSGKVVNEDDESVAFTRYTLHLRDDLHYQPHPAFALDASGRPEYLFETAAAGERYHQIPDFPHTGDRPVHANDYVYAIKRLADPVIGSPMLGFMSQYIVGMKAFSEQVASLPRGQWLDLDNYAMEGLEVVDERTLTITIIGRYPQFLFWLAMPFFFTCRAGSRSVLSQPRLRRSQSYLGLVAGRFRAISYGQQ